MISSLTHHREQARVVLLTKVNGCAPKPVQPKQDDTLRADTLELYDALIETMGPVEFARWLELEYPWLEKTTTPLIRVWWVLQNQHDALLCAGRGVGEDGKL